MSHSPRLALILSTIMLAACPDPNVNPATPAAAPGPAVGGAAPTPGVDAPSGGEGGKAPAAAAATPATTGAPTAPGVGVLPALDLSGKTVTLSGTLTYSGSKTGQLRIDVNQVEAGSGQKRPVHVVKLDKLGNWSAELPANLGEVSLVGFMDIDGNGPGPEEPGAVIAKVDVGSDDVGSLAMAMVEGGAAQGAIGDDDNPPPPAEAGGAAGAAEGAKGAAETEAPAEAPADEPAAAPQ